MTDVSENSTALVSADNPLSAEAGVVETASEPNEVADPFAAELEAGLGLEPEDETGPAGSVREAVEQAQLPSGFDSIAHQLPKAVTSKLKQLDTSTAVLSIRVGNETYPDIQLAFLIAGDFASNVVQMIGVTGMICCTVKAPRFKPFHFAFHVQASAESQNNVDPMQALAQQISREFQKAEARHKKEIDDLRMEMEISASGNSGGGFLEEIEKFKAVAEVMKTLTPAPQAIQPAADFSGQMRGMADAFKSVAEVTKDMQATAGIIAKPEKSFAEEAKEILAIPLVKDVAESAVEGVKMKLAGKSAAANPSSEPHEPDTDPFVDDAEVA